MTELGTFVLSSESRRAKSAAVFAAALFVSAFVGAGLGTRRWALGLLAPVAGVAVYLLEARRRKRALAVGTVALDGGALVFRRKEQTLHRIPVAEASFTGRALRVSADQRARVQIVVQWNDRALVAQLAIPFRAAPHDEEGVFPAIVELDRTASRAFDALAHGKLGAVSPKK